MNQTIHLPISDKYVQHWGFWEAIREILQNAIDTKDYEVDGCHLSRTFKVKSFGGKLDLSTLMLGESSKQDDDDSIGKYGEGYKLALLVLCRLGYDVAIKNGLDFWRISLEPHPQLNATCLTVKISEGVYVKDGESKNNDSVIFMVENVKDEDFEIIKDNFIANSMDRFEIKAEYDKSYCFEYRDGYGYEETKKVFVGGLFVCDLPENDEYRYSYNFAPNVLTLDRDRSCVNDFSLQYNATRIISSSGNLELLAEMANAGAEDISGYYSHGSGCSSSSFNYEGRNEDTIHDFALKGFIDKHGKNAHPISENEAQVKKDMITEKCIKSGIKPVIVKLALYNILPKSIKEITFVETIKGKISEELNLFIKSNRKQITPLGKSRLNKIIEMIKFQGN